jgi:hypothetical protein
MYAAKRVRFSRSGDGSDCSPDAILHDPPASARERNRGESVAKGFEEPVRVYEVSWRHYC